MDKRADPSLSDSEVRRRHALVEQLTGIGYWEVDLTKRTLLWSAATYRLFGVDPATFKPSLDRFDRFIHPDDLEAVRAAIHASRDGGTAYQIEHRIVRPDSTVRHVLEHGQHEYDEAARPIFFRGTVQDISPINEIRERLVRAEREATLSRVMGEVAHDFNNLLSVVSGNLDILRIRYGDMPDAGRLLDRAQASVVNGAALAERLLAFFNRQLSVPVTIDLGTTVREFLPTLARVVGEQVVIEFRSTLDGVLCRLDKVRLETALLNAVLNARDAMPGGGRITLSISGAEAADPAAPMVRLAIADTGTGIPPAIREQVFEPFFTTRSNHGGTGLGLAIIRDFAQDSGGTVALRSAPGEGTTLSILLPVQVGAGPPDRQPAPLPAVRRTGRTIILVEDNRNVLEFVEEGLSDLGFEVAAFGLPAHALGYLEETTATVSAILCDVRLPGSMDGFAFVRAARRLRADLPALLISGNVGRVPTGKLPAGPDTRLLRKPFRITDLAAALQDLIRPG